MKDINNTIHEDFCSFEVSKLLKEKGFNTDVLYHYRLENKKWLLKGNSFLVREMDAVMFKDDGFNGICVSVDSDRLLKNYASYDNTFIAAPTHNVAIKWIRENSRPDFCINVFPYIYRNKTLYEIRIFGHHFRESQFETPEEGIDSGILYSLKNII